MVLTTAMRPSRSVLPDGPCASFIDKESGMSGRTHRQTAGRPAQPASDTAIPLEPRFGAACNRALVRASLGNDLV